jgi:ADP-heptose:LPS heptosyltransferase
MWRNPNDVRPITINVLLDGGGLGDTIAKVPVIKYILANVPHVDMIVWAPNYFIELMEYWFGTEPRIQIKKLSDIAHNNLPAISARSADHTSIKTHLTKHAFHNMLDMDTQTDFDMNYPVIPEEPKENYGNYMVIAPNYTAPSRSLPTQTINEIAEWAFSKGLNVLYLGKAISQHTEKQVISGITPPNLILNHNNIINLLDKTTLLEAASIMGKARVVVGLDSGLLHLAACTNVQIVGGFTTVDPVTRMPYRAGSLGWRYEPVVPDGCRFCQTRMHFVYNHDFRTCYYGDFQCTKQLTSKKFIDVLSEIV